MSEGRAQPKEALISMYQCQCGFGISSVKDKVLPERQVGTP